jgi:anti-sigma-K factor RskA
VSTDHPSRDDLVAYSLGALEPGEERGVEDHVPGCARCIRELEALAPAVAVLGESVEQLEPPPELRERVLAVVRSEAEPDRAPEPAVRRKPRNLRSFLMRPATALAALAIAVAGVAGYLVRDTGGGESTEPVVAATGIGGSLVVGDTSSMLSLHGMAPLSKQAVYQAWVQHDSSVRPSSNFIPDSSGNAMTAIDGHLSSGDQVMVTRESAPGHTTPTGPILLTATVD